MALAFEMMVIAIMEKGLRSQVRGRLKFTDEKGVARHSATFPSLIAIYKKKGKQKMKLLAGFSLKRALGITKVKNRISRKTKIPLTRSGRQRKIGKLLGIR